MCSTSAEFEVDASGGVRLRCLVPPELAGKRLDAGLTKLLRNHTRWRVQRFVRAGRVVVNGSVAGPRHRLRPGDLLDVSVPEPPDGWYEPEPGPLTVLFEDEHLLAVDKPTGMTVHPTGSRQSGTLLNRVQAYLDRDGVRGVLRPGVVHRLDASTSGVIVLAKTHLAHATLTRSFERREVRKTYLAVVEGEVAGPGGVIDKPIGRSPCGKTLLRSCAADAIDAKPAATRYRVLRRYAGRTALLCRPRTGRNHQIRVHLASLGHPLVGEPFYRADGTLAERDGERPAGRLGLHARSIAFTHPVDGRPLRVVAPVPTDPEFVWGL